MKISSIAEYIKEEEINDSQERGILHIKFPHVVVIEGDYPEIGVALRWCWSKFGSQNGECLSWEYPSCPLVLATERLEMREVMGKKWQEKVYDRPIAHCHTGEWTLHWLGKTDYDHGFGEFCFKHEDQKESFVQQIAMFDWGENYPWLTGE